MDSISLLDISSYLKVVVPKGCTIKILWPMQDMKNTYVYSDAYISFENKLEHQTQNNSNLSFDVERDSVVTQKRYYPPKCSHELKVEFDQKLAFYSEETSMDGTRCCIEIIVNKAGVHVKRFNNITLKDNAGEDFDDRNGLGDEDESLKVLFSDDNSSEDSDESLTPSSTNTITAQVNTPAAGYYKLGPNLDIVFRYGYCRSSSSRSKETFTCVKSPFSLTNSTRVYLDNL